MPELKEMPSWGFFCSTLCFFRTAILSFYQVDCSILCLWVHLLGNLFLWYHVSLVFHSIGRYKFLLLHLKYQIPPLLRLCVIFGSYDSTGCLSETFLFCSKRWHSSSSVWFLMCGFFFWSWFSQVYWEHAQGTGSRVGGWAYHLGLWGYPLASREVL